MVSKKNNAFQEFYELCKEEIKKGGQHRARILRGEESKRLKMVMDNLEYIIERAEIDSGYRNDDWERLLLLFWNSAVSGNIADSVRLGSDRRDYLLFVAEVKDNETLLWGKMHHPWKRIQAQCETFLAYNEEDINRCNVIYPQSYLGPRSYLRETEE